MYPNSEWWLIVEQILYYTQALYQGQWQVAYSAVLQLSTMDKWEGLIRYDLLYFKLNMFNSVAKERVCLFIYHLVFSSGNFV